MLTPTETDRLCLQLDNEAAAAVEWYKATAKAPDGTYYKPTLRQEQAVKFAFAAGFARALTLASEQPK